MTFKPPVRRAALALAFCASAALPAAAACPAADPSAVSGAVQGMFSALAAGDLQTSRSYLAPEFFIFDGGVRFDGTGIMDVIARQQKDGSIYVWKVTDPEVRFACTTAWIAYVNKGSVTKDGATVPVTWLESGVLEHRSGRWLIVFMHSTRTPAPKP